MAETTLLRRQSQIRSKVFDFQASVEEALKWILQNSYIYDLSCWFYSDTDILGIRVTIVLVFLNK